MAMCPDGARSGSPAGTSGMNAGRRRNRSPIGFRPVSDARRGISVTRRRGRGHHEGMNPLLALVGEVTADPDGRLLERFLAGRDEQAFAQLVRRYGPVVWGVCRRALADQ